MGRRPLAAATAIAACVALSGCAVTGTIDVGADAVGFDVTFVSAGAQLCAGQPAPLRFEYLGTDEAGNATCHLSGVLDRASPSAHGAVVLDALAPVGDDALLFLLPAYAAAQPGNENITAIDLTITFPDTVTTVSRGGTASGRAAHITDAAAVRAQGITVVAQRGARVPAGLLLGLGGLGVGVAAGVLVAAVSRRRRAAEDEPPVEVGEDVRDVGDVGVGDVGVEDPSDWRPSPDDLSDGRPSSPPRRPSPDDLSGPSLDDPTVWRPSSDDLSDGRSSSDDATDRRPSSDDPTWRPSSDDPTRRPSSDNASDGRPEP